jgi:predicted metal-binding membrane protein
MALLFVGGVMNLLWIALLAGAVLIEKLLPFGATLAKLAGLALCAGGIWLLAAPFAIG